MSHKRGQNGDAKSLLCLGRVASLRTATMSESFSGFPVLSMGPRQCGAEGQASWQGSPEPLLQAPGSFCFISPHHGQNISGRGTCHTGRLGFTAGFWNL